MPYGRQSSRRRARGRPRSGLPLRAERGDCVGELAGSVQRRDVVAAKRLLQLEDAQPVGLALEPVRKQSPSPWPVRRQLARRHMANAQARQVEPPARRESDDRSDRAVRTLRAEERLLEAGIGALERLVAPVEAAASLRRLLQQREQHRPQQRPASSADRRRAPARRSRQPALVRAPPVRSARPGAPRAARRGPPGRDQRAGDTRRASADRGPCSSNANGRSPPSSSSRNATAKAARQNARSAWWR